MYKIIDKWNVIILYGKKSHADFKKNEDLINEQINILLNT